MPDLDVLHGALAALTAGHGGGMVAITDEPAPRTDLLLAGPRGFAYTCNRCEVMGFVIAHEPRTCWSCGEGDALASR